MSLSSSIIRYNIYILHTIIKNNIIYFIIFILNFNYLKRQDFRTVSFKSFFFLIIHNTFMSRQILFMCNIVIHIDDALYQFTYKIYCTYYQEYKRNNYKKTLHTCYHVIFILLSHYGTEGISRYCGANW